MSRLATLYIDKQSHKFSAAHYTIFSATERERLHGHNYSVSVKIVAPMGNNGFSADYNLYKTRVGILCDALDEYLILAGDSPHQVVERQGDSYSVKFSDCEMSFLCSDTHVLAITNVTIEELSYYLLQGLLQVSEGEGLQEVELCVASGDGQKACSGWRHSD